MITATGTYRGEKVTVEWADGQMSGPAAALEAIQQKADDLEGQRVGHPTGPLTTTNHLAAADGFRFCAHQVLGDCELVGGYDDPIWSPEDAPNESAVL
ncbi:MAG: hypothetical protein AB7S38_28960 [Vulcanimicrobiota bacterium]